MCTFVNINKKKFGLGSLVFINISNFMQKKYCVFAAILTDKAHHRTFS